MHWNHFLNQIQTIEVRRKKLKLCLDELKSAGKIEKNMTRQQSQRLQSETQQEIFRKKCENISFWPRSHLHFLNQSTSGKDLVDRSHLQITRNIISKSQE